MFDTITANSLLSPKILLLKENSICSLILDSFYKAYLLTYNPRYFLENELDPDENLTMNFDDLLKKTMGLLGVKK